MTIGGSSNTRIALLTDGASRTVDLYGIHTWPSALKTMDSPGPGELLRQLRHAEDSDLMASRYPRVKVRDDATVIVNLNGPGK